mgnify:CR=1 FL=1
MEASRKRQAWLEGIADISSAVLSGSQADEFLPMIARRARALILADAAVILVPSQSGLLVEAVDVAPAGEDQRTADTRWSVHRSRRRTERSDAFDGLEIGRAHV